MARVVCPGSFDPVTNGHLDIIGRAAGLHDEVIVAVLINITKKTLFTVDERVEILSEVTRGYGNVRVERFHGLCHQMSRRVPESRFSVRIRPGEQLEGCIRRDGAGGIPNLPVNICGQYFFCQSFADGLCDR